MWFKLSSYRSIYCIMLLLHDLLHRVSFCVIYCYRSRTLYLLVNIILLIKECVSVRRKLKNFSHYVAGEYFACCGCAKLSQFFEEKVFELGMYGEFSHFVLAWIIVLISVDVSPFFSYEDRCTRR